MGNFLKRTSFGLEAQVRTFKKKGELLEFAVFPMVHAASEEFYDGVQEELEGCDIILYEGVRSTKARILIRGYEIAARSPRLRLHLQRTRLDLSRLRDRLFHADQDAIDYENEWNLLPWFIRLRIRFMGPLVGIFCYLVLTREILAKILEPSGLPAGDEWSNESEYESPLKKITGGSRDRHILAQVNECYNVNSGSPIRVGVLFGAAHAEVIGEFLSRKLGFHVSSAKRLNAFKFDL